jgi:peptidoglycan/LPS O-acetylase OafA/YrhL
MRNLDILRLILALVVCCFHIDFLSGTSTFAPIYTVLTPHLAVSIFFILSGFLIFRTCERTNWRAFYAARFRRIYPAYFVVIILSALLFATSVPEFTRYVLPNLLFLNFLQPDINGTIINGALWTIKIEVMFYAIVPAIVWAARRTNPVLLMLAIIVLSLVFSYFAPPLIARQLPGQLWLFAIGGLLHYKGLKPSGRLPVDISYGLYIVHYPITQGLIIAGLFSPASALSLSLIAAFALWQMVERQPVRVAIPA